MGDTPYSLFVTGSTGDMDESGIARGFIVGNVLTDNIRDTRVNAIHAQFTNRGRTFNSMVQCDSANIARMVEQFYAQSEQYPLRIELSDDSDTAQGVVALPEYDDEWIRKISFEELSTSDAVERSHMRTCNFEFQCECSPEKLIPFFQAMTPRELEELYGEDQELDISCPRCGRHFFVSRCDLRTEH
jgi:molecular chaperone Hsp33